MRICSSSRWVFFLAAVALAWSGPWMAWTAVVLPALSPFAALSSALATRAVGIITLLSVPALLLVVLYPRWFCRCACPAGFIQDLLGILWPRASLDYRWLRVGRWIVLLTLGGAFLGYPIFIWLDPLALFNGSLQAWHGPFSPVTLLSGLGLPLLLVLALVTPGLWCRGLCPLGAFQDLLSRPPTSRAAPGRREFLAAGAGAAAALLAGALRSEASPLRPPGALSRGRFSGVCARCGNCARVCPSHIVRRETAGVLGLLAPVLDFTNDYCREDCNRCGSVCPTGAIARLSIDAKRRSVIGLAVLDLDTCRLANGEECTACISVCPYRALSVETAADGLSSKPLLDLTKCNGCGACEVACPLMPKAVKVLSSLTVHGG